MSEQKEDYIKLKGWSGFSFAAHLVPAVGALGLVLAVVGLYQGAQSGDFSSAFAGIFLSLLLLPAFFKSGMELDPKNKRFREFEGFLGNTKDPWIDVDQADYLSIVGFVQTQSGSGRRPSATVTTGMSKVYFWSGDWHLELFKGNYDQALKFAETFSGHFGLSINDVNKDQNLGGPSQGSPMNHSF